MQLHAHIDASSSYYGVDGKELVANVYNVDMCVTDNEEYSKLVYNENEHLFTVSIENGISGSSVYASLRVNSHHIRLMMIAD